MRMGTAPTQRKSFGNKAKAEQRIKLLWVSVKSLVQCLAQYALFLWQHNPIAVVMQRQRRLGFVENYGEVLIKPKLSDRVVDLFLTDYRRRKRLLAWVSSRLHRVAVFDFCSSWQDGIALCALLESVCPGVCPSYHLLQQHNRVKNCRLGIKLAHKYLYLPMDLLSPEEMAIANPSTEPKIMQYISMLKWASQNIKDKWVSLHESLIAAKTGKCFAKGAGLRNGIAGRRSKFTIIVSDTIGVFNLLVEVRGPDNEYSGERIVSLHQAKGMLDKGMIFDAMEPTRQNTDTIKYMEDGSGSTFVRKKVPPRFTEGNIEPIQLDIQCGEEGSFYVTFVPKRAGMHNVSVRWQNHHVEGSPFRVKVYKASNISTKTMRGAQEKRLIYDSFSVDGSQEGSISGSERLTDDSANNSFDGLSSDGRTAAAIAKSKAYSKGRQLTVTRRRVLRRIITRNGEDIVIEEAVSPTLSRQSSATDNSDDDSRFQKSDHIRELVPSRALLPLTTNNLHMLNTSAHASNTLCTVIEEEREKLSSIGSSSSGGHALDTDAVTDALNQFKAQSPNDSINPKRRQYSIDIIETSGDQPKRDLLDIQTKISGRKSPMNVIVKEECPSPFVGDGNDKDKKHRTETAGLTTINDAEEICTVKDLGTWRELDANDQSMGSGNTDVDGTKTKLEKICEISEESQEKTLVSLEKTTACRTSSDGPLFELRKETVSAVATMTTTSSSFDESSSEISSGDINSPDEENEVSPQLKLLHSTSLKKACIYVSHKALGSDGEELSPLHSVKEIKKTKLTTTQSLPIMRKLHRTEEDDKYSIQDLLKSLRQLEQDIKTDSNDSQCQSEENLNTDKNLEKNDHALVDSLKALPVPYEIPENQNTSKEYPTHSINTEMNPLLQVNEKIENTVDVNKLQTESDLEDLSQPANESNDTEIINIPVLTKENIPALCSKLETQKETQAYIRTPPREPLKRQNPINQSKNSSQESSNESDKKPRGSKDKNSEYEELKEEVTSELKQVENNVFRSISIQRSPLKDTSYTSLVHIVIPKPKVDKSTQVSHTEITAETGWKVIEGLYLLMRRISINVPTLTDEAGTEIAIQPNNQNGIPKSVVINNGAAFPTVDPTARGGSGDMNRNVSGGNLPLPSLNVESVRINGDLNVRNNVDDWLERNREIMNIQANLLEPARQLTVDTVDSGYDDNPLNYNRSPRWSLPLIRQSNVNPNGHPRLFRRPYKGQMILPAKLVLSLSSQSQGNSFEKREKDDDADDENDNSVEEYNFDSEKLNLIRKRRHFSRRVESFSLSDSELETKKSSYKRNRRGWKDVLLVNRLFPKKERVKTITSWALEKHCDTAKRKVNTINRLPSVLGVKQLSLESTDDDVTIFTESTGPTNLNQKHSRMNVRNSHPPSSWKDVSSGSDRHLNSVSSLEDSYRGFGVHKQSRNEFLSHIDEFQNLCPADMDVNKPEQQHTINEDDENKLEIKSVSKMSISSRSTESEGMDEELLKSYIRNKRHSWDGILDDFSSYDYNLNLEYESDTEKDAESNNLLQVEADGLDVVSDVENIFGDDGSYIGEFMQTASNTDLYECFEQTSDAGSEEKVDKDVCESITENESKLEELPEIIETICTQKHQEDETLGVSYFEDTDRKIRVAGPGLYGGLVGVKNSFQVWSCDSGCGSLNVNITGPRSHSVTETSVLYTGDNLYEVTYEVTQPGFYKIYVKWADINIPNSPFIAEITF